MAYLGETFDPGQVPEDERSFDPLPAGDYDCQVIESEIAGTKSGGEMLKLTLEVIDGPHANRKIWDNLNIRNSNADAQRIAHRALADLCAAVGAGAIQDSEELHYKPFVATLKIEPARTVGDRTYDARNGVKRYKPRGGTAAAPATSRTAAPPPPRANGAAGGGKPWGQPGGRQQPSAARAPMQNEPPF